MAANDSRLSWGILGTGRIAHVFAEGLAKSRTGQLVAAASRRQETANAFAQKFASIRAYDTYEKLLADPAVQAVYISAPHPFHAEWCIRAARAKKHILCEKPLTLNHTEALAVVEAAKSNGVFLMEAFMYRCHPQMARLVELIRGGAIGEVGLIKATFGFSRGFQAEHRLFKNELGGGSILDIGCYTMSISRLVAGAALGLPFANPTQIHGFAQLHPETQTDLYATATLQFPGGILAQLSSAVSLTLDTSLHVFGSAGSIYMKTPFNAGHGGGESIIFLTQGNSGKTEEIRVHTSEYLFALEADAVGDAVAEDKRESPYVTWEDTLGNMAALDAWRSSARFLYHSEKTHV
jgi:predicted dehydrogenase